MNGRRRRRRVAAPSRPFRAVTGPNDVWCLDFKGWFRTIDRDSATAPAVRGGLKTPARRGSLAPPSGAIGAPQHSQAKTARMSDSAPAPSAAFKPVRLEPGEVWLVGAGPGDPGLLTLHAWHALAQADAAVYDALVGPDILAMIPETAERHFAGKRGGRPSARQPDISRRLVALARAGRRVVRLKGGDPYLFGRGGEEALALVRAGVPFRVVPGISAGLGGLAHAGIPLTHRATNASVSFVTGHDASGAVPETVDWQALARGSQAIVIYMALRHLARIAARLRAGGRRDSEPVAIVSRATLPGQTVLETTLGACVAAAEAAAVAPPAVVVVGEIVRLRAGLDWPGALGGRVLDPDPLAHLPSVKQ